MMEMLKTADIWQLSKKLLEDEVSSHCNLGH